MCSAPCSARPTPATSGRSRRLDSWCSPCWYSKPPPNWHRWITCQSAPGCASGCRSSMPLRCGTSWASRPGGCSWPSCWLPSPRVASGRYRVRVGGRTRTRRFSELDPVRLAGLRRGSAGRTARHLPQARRRDAVPDRGFPRLRDHARPRPASWAAACYAPPACRPQSRSAWPARPPWSCGSTSGARWYRAARDLAPAATARVLVARDVADRFRQARRVLNHLADRYLLPPDNPWFEQPPA